MKRKTRYNERLMNESLQGNDESLKELNYNAGSGNCEAQYFLAMYYARVCGHLHNPNYHYWLEKSKENGYVPGVGDVRTLTPEQLHDLEAMSFKNFIKTLFLEYRVLIGLGVFG